MHRYRVYGLALDSERELPELFPRTDEAPAEVTVRWAAVEASTPPSPEDKSWVETRLSPRRTICVFEGVGRYEVREGGEVRIEPEPNVDPGLVRHGLVGPVLAQLLWQRDIFTLHASVVRIGERHAAFIGVSGEGKSTTAAALEAHGHSLVCDDIAAIPWQDAPIVALPGFPRIRLHDDSMRGVGELPDAHPLIHSLIDKRLKRAVRFVTEPVVLDKIYVLESAPALLAEPLSPQKAMMELMKHAYNAYQLAPLVGFQRHMQMAAAVSSKVPAFRLLRPKDLARLPELVGFIESHLRS